MEGQTKKFRKLLNSSRKILITSHISPDPDAVCSVLLLGTTLQLNFPDKKIAMVLEEKPARDLSFLNGYKKIEFNNVLSITKKLRPELIIIVDAMNYERVSRSEGAKMRKLIQKDLDAGLMIIDHHTEVGLEPSDLYINNHLPATVQEII